MKNIIIKDLGLINYQKYWDLQEKIHKSIIDIMREKKKKNMEFYLSNETIKRSKFKFLKPRDIINLELPLKYGTKISGHICQGHVDTVGKIQNIKIIDKTWILKISIPAKFKKYTILMSAII